MLQYVTIYRSIAFLYNETATTYIYTYSHTLSRHDALPITIPQALSGLSLETPTDTLTRRKGDNQALIGPTWGKTTAMNTEDKIRSLTEVQYFDGNKITPPVDSACKL